MNAVAIILSPAYMTNLNKAVRFIFQNSSLRLPLPRNKLETFTSLGDSRIFLAKVFEISASQGRNKLFQDTIILKYRDVVSLKLQNLF